MQKTGEIARQSESRAAVYWLFALVTIGAALGNLSQTGVNTMLPAIMAEFGVDVDVGQWLTTGYMLMLGVAVPVATYLMRRFDDRAYAALSFGLFAVGSLVDLVAPEFFTMLIGRVLQAIAVGLIVPKMQAIAMTKFPPGRRATAMGIAGIALGFAPNIGPTVGGAMDYSFGWRSFFVLMVGITVLLVVLTLLVVKPDTLPDTSARFETVSFVYSTLGFGGVLLGLSQASSYGIASPWVWAPIIIGAVFLVLFVRRQRVVDQPLMDLRIFESRIFTGGLLASLFVFACFMGVTLVIPLYVIEVLGGTSLDAGLVILPSTITALIVNPLSGVMADKTSPRLTTLIFGTFLVVGSVSWVLIGEDTPLWLLAVWQTIRAIGVSGLIGPLVTFSLSGLKGPLVPHGSTAQVIGRQVAATFGTAIMVLLMTLFVDVVAVGSASSALPYQAAFALSALMAIMAMLLIVARVK